MVFQNPSSRLSCKALILKRASQPNWPFHNHMILEVIRDYSELIRE
jgi:hypothetical protein